MMRIEAAKGRLAGQSAIVTGGTSGIGAEVVRRFAAEGAKQVVVALPEEEGVFDDLVASLPAGRAAVFLGGDITGSDTASAAVRICEEFYGGVDILVNNAGIDYSGVSVLESDVAYGRRVMDVNFFAAFLMLQKAGRSMLQRGGAIVNVASRAGVVGVSSMALYGASKAALISLTKTAALELAPSVRVNAVAPGATDTPMMRSWIDGQEDPAAFEAALVASIPQRRLARPSEVANAVLFLASRESQHITGATVCIDGGYTTG